ncbi:MAG: hypothetical protein ACTHQM_09675 [Thermoanaerobaculia bacterium]
MAVRRHSENTEPLFAVDRNGQVVNAHDRLVGQLLVDLMTFVGQILIRPMWYVLSPSYRRKVRASWPEDGSKHVLLEIMCIAIGLAGLMIVLIVETAIVFVLVHI